MEKSLTFYRDILGLELKRQMKPTESMELAFLGGGDTQVELICDQNHGEISFGGDISMGFIVESIEGFMDDMEQKNLTLHAGPFQPNPFTKFIYILDPDGMKIQLVENLKP